MYPAKLSGTENDRCRPSRRMCDSKSFITMKQRGYRLVQDTMHSSTGKYRTYFAIPGITIAGASALRNQGDMPGMYPKRRVVVIAKICANIALRG